MDNALKAISRTDDELRVGNYIVLFGDTNTRDLEGIATPRINGDGSIGEYFTKSTVLDSTFTRLGRIPLSWEHGKDAPDPGNLGYVDWSTAKADERGLFVERVLRRSNKYVQWIAQLIDAGRISTSSGSKEALAKKGADGEILVWPLFSDSLTAIPMDWRMLSGNALQAAKALGLFAEQPTPEGEPGAAASGGESVKATTEGIDITIKEDEMSDEDKVTNVTNKVTAVTMEPDALAALVSQAVADGVEAYKAAQPAPSAGHVIMDELDHNAMDPDIPAYKSIGEQLQDVWKAAMPGARPSARLLKAHKAVSGLSEGIAADGGFAVGTDQAGEFMRPVYDDSPLLSGMSRHTITSNSNSLSLWGINETSRETGSRYGGVRAYRLSEGDVKTPTKIGLRDIRLELHTVACLAYATDELLQDASLLGSIISEAAQNELRFFMADDVLRGTGAGMPTGVLNAAALITVVKEAGQAANSVVAENILKMWVRMPPSSRAKAIWFVNQEVEPWLQQMSIGLGGVAQLVYMPPGGLSASPYGAIFGRPVVSAEHMSQVGDVGDIGLFDMSQYKWIDKGGIQEATSIHVRFKWDEKCFRFTVRYDGQPGWSSALSPYKGTTTTGTLSPFVVLAARD